MQSVGTITEDGGAIVKDAGTSRARRSGQKAVAIYLTWGVFLIFRGVVDLKIYSLHPSQIYFVVGVCLPILIGSVCCLLGLILAFGIKSLGSISHDEISDPRVEQRVRERYSSDIDELTSLGFSYAYTSGEGMGLPHVLLIYPAIILLRARANGAVLTLGRGGKVLLAAPVLTSADRRTFAHPESLGVSFYTAFRNGLLLVTKNFDFPFFGAAEYMLLASDATDTEAWQTHKGRLNKLDTEANPANTDQSYHAFADIALREDAFLKSQQ
jgi:hypothetical protein